MIDVRDVKYEVDDALQIRESELHIFVNLQRIFIFKTQIRIQFL